MIKTGDAPGFWCTLRRGPCGHGECLRQQRGRAFLCSILSARPGPFAVYGKLQFGGPATCMCVCLSWDYQSARYATVQLPASLSMCHRAILYTRCRQSTCYYVPPTFVSGRPLGPSQPLHGQSFGCRCTSIQSSPCPYLARAVGETVFSIVPSRHADESGPCTPGQACMHLETLENQNV